MLPNRVGLLVAIAFVILPHTGLIAVAETRPPGLSPTFVTVTEVDNEHNSITISYLVRETLRREVRRGDEDEESVREFVEYHVNRQANCSILLDAWRVIDTNGNEISGDALWRRLKTGQIIVFGEKSPVAAEYLRVLAPEVLVIEVRSKK